MPTYSAAVPARRLLPLVLGAACLAALGGCGAAPTVLRGDEQTRLLVSGDANSQDVPLSGTLVILPGGCLGIDGGTAPSVIAWPPGTTFAGGDTVGIRLPEGRVIRVGDPVNAGGGLLDPADPATPPKPSDCPGGEIFTVSNVALPPR
jgi:hypothetical protein